MSYFKQMKQKGFSLMEIMVAVSLLGVLSVAIISQQNIATDTKVTNEQNATINLITDRLAVELAKQETCSSAANFKSKEVNRVFGQNPWTTITSLYASDGTTKLLELNQEYGRNNGRVVLKTAAGKGGSLVKVVGIKTYQSADDTNKMILELKFKRYARSAGISLWGTTSVVNLPIAIVKDGIGNIDFCYNDITNSIASAIRLSCQGNTSYYDPTINPPYGVCQHKVTTLDCPSNQFIRRIEYDSATGQKTIKTTCASLNVTCPAGKVITQFNANGTVTCDYPFPQCAPGQLMIKSAAGPYVCAPTNVACGPLQAMKAINESSITCAQYYPPRTCGSGVVTNYAPDGSITCAPLFKPVTCPPGKAVGSVDANGQPQCDRTLYATGTYCPGGQAVTGLDAAGNIQCATLDRRLFCSGATVGRTYSQCRTAGGTIYNPGTSNAYCHFNADNCLGSFVACQDWRRRGAASCTDQHSNCATAVRSYYLAAQGYSNPVYREAVQCRYWKSIGKSGCGYHDLPPVWTPIYEVGCY